MQNKEFVRLIQSLMPSINELKEYGLSEEEIEGIRMTYRCNLQKVNNNIQPARARVSELEKLVLEYDCSTMEIFSIRFCGKPLPHHLGMIVAFWEADPIVVLKSGEVVAFDHANPNNIFAPCAANSERFLDAMAWLVKVRARKAVWKGRGKEIVDACAEKAGGSVYQDFYRTLCTFFD